MKLFFRRRLFAARRGSSLIEVLVALAILSIMMAGILQLFSLALLASAGAAARTELIFRCQQVVENVRLCYYIYGRNPLQVPAGAGIPNPIAPATVDLPYKMSDANWLAQYPFWGPDGANVVTESAGPYKIRYTITSVALLTNPPPAAIWTITVSATPTDDPTARRFFGFGLKNFKRVDYVASFVY